MKCYVFSYASTIAPINNLRIKRSTIFQTMKYFIAFIFSFTE